MSSLMCASFSLVVVSFCCGSIVVVGLLSVSSGVGVLRSDCVQHELLHLELDGVAV